eukprot:4035155-Lingulodinium_polyedra.AAC.1
MAPLLKLAARAGGSPLQGGRWSELADNEDDDDDEAGQARHARKQRSPRRRTRRCKRSWGTARSIWRTICTT